MENVGRILGDLHSVGIDVPPYPQMRSFIDIYLEPLVEKEVLVRKGEFYYLSSVERLEELRRHEPSIPEAEETVRLVREKKYRFKGLRAPVTGVFTLSSRIYVDTEKPATLDNTLVARKELVEYMVEYVRRHVEYMAKLGYTVLFTDEPFLGVIVGRRRLLFGYTDEEIIETLNRVYKGIPGEHAIHVCGRISPRLFELLSRVEELKILNFEFFDNPANIDAINRRALEENDKLLAPGVASSKKPVVESIEDITRLLRRIIERIGWRIDLVSADCGFGGLATRDGDREKAYQIGLRKLENIVKAVNNIRPQMRRTQLNTLY
jgi:5-methyltetrahydropteroyltriglutamate--homocysteine methyltransferase